MTDVESGFSPKENKTFNCDSKSYDINSPTRPTIVLQTDGGISEDPNTIIANQFKIDFNDLGEKTVVYLGRQPHTQPGVNIDPSRLSSNEKHPYISRAHGKLYIREGTLLEWKDTSSNGSTMYDPLIHEYEDDKLVYHPVKRTLKGTIDNETCEIRSGSILELAAPREKESLPGVYLLFYRDRSTVDPNTPKTERYKWTIERVTDLQHLTSQQATVARSWAGRQVEPLQG